MKYRIAAVFLTLVCYSFTLVPTVYAQSVWGVGCVGSAEYKTTDGKGASDVATIQGIECLIGNVLATVVTIIGIAAFVMFLIGSFRYLTAGSNSKEVEGGKNAITFAILGIVVALASIIILKFISQFTGVTTILQFNTQVENIR